MRLAFPLIAATVIALSGCIESEDVHRTRPTDEHVGLPIRLGMEPEQVLKRIGTPTNVAHGAQVAWYYALRTPGRDAASGGDVRVRRRLAAVYFTPRLKVERVALYTLVEGALVDTSSSMPVDIKTVAIWHRLYDDRLFSRDEAGSMDTLSRELDQAVTDTLSR